jgi:microcystin degradation protein MlrC
LRGEQVFSGTDGYNLPIAGFIKEARRFGHELVPTVWAAANPSSYVTQDAYERIAGQLIDDLKAGGSYDAVYLCLHGAMVAEHVEDGEGELMARVRRVVGDGIPVVASLDLHCNTTPEMMRHATAMIGYRTYPHTDMAATGARVAHHLHGLLNGSGATKRAFRQIPFLIPLTFQCTYIEPAKSIYRLLESLETGTVKSLTFNPGFPAADIHHCGAAVFGYGTDQAAVDAAVDGIADEVVRQEAAWDGKLYSPEDAVAYAIRRGNQATKPITIADTQDNPGVGGDSNTTVILHALHRQQARDAAIGLIWDPEAAEAAHGAGVGASITLDLGGKSRVPGDKPFRGTFVVEKLGDGKFTGTGPMYGGARMTLGNMACLRIGGVRIAVSSRKVQLADQAIFRHVGIEPTQQKILVLKSSVHFRADFQPISEEVIVCESPGPMIVDPARFPWKRLRPGLKLRPNGPVFQGA